MKTSGKIIGMLLLLLVAGNGCHNAQHGRRNKMDSTKMNRSGMSSDLRQNKKIGPKSDSMMMRGMGLGMRRGMGPWEGHEMMRGMGPMDRMGRGPMGPERWIMESIPNITEKQKKEISDLRLTQQDEMKKLREEMSAKMKSLRESDKKKMMDLLTDEQKKFIESMSGNTNPAPVKAK